MRIIRVNKDSAREAAGILKKGGLVVYPTETLYGIGADATNITAVEKLNKYKQRPFGKPYSIAVSDQKMAQKYVELNETAKNLYKEFLPGPATIISKGKHKVAPGVESEIGTLGIRIPDYPLVREIVKNLGHPITATSANASYQKRPYKLPDILENISGSQKKLIDLAIDAGELPRREPSTVIDTTLEDLVILRQGGIKLKDRNEVLSRSEENTQNLAKEIFQKYQRFLGKRPLLIALAGEMGAGKTQFTKGLGKALGIKEEIVSPTFSLVLEYPHFAHFDVWKLKNPKELDSLGLTKILEDKNMVVAIEWADRVIDGIKSRRDQATIIWVKISYGKAENERLINWGAI